MNLRSFGSTGMKVSEVGFGAWAIGGNAYGAVERRASLAALARAEELGCNFVDTAAVYGSSEAVLGEFLRGRRHRWLISTKYSAQPEGVERTIEAQLAALGTDTIDFYQIHWAPGRDEQRLYEDLYRLKKTGKARAVGVSLKTANDIDRVLADFEIDGFMVRVSLLDPEPLSSQLRRIRERGIAVIARSALKEGFLTGKFGRDATFRDPNDQRHHWNRERVAATVDAVERFRGLESEGRTLMAAAAAYPLAFPEVSTLVLGTKNAEQAEDNFGTLPAAKLSAGDLELIRGLQKSLGLRSSRKALMEKLRALLRRR
jgi:aryl-alcohol dehydrogenase-like predicted oxidoreductase